MVAGGGTGRPAKLHADKGYDYENLRKRLRARNIVPRIVGEVTVGRPSQRHFGGMLASWLSRSQSAGLDCGLCH